MKRLLLPLILLLALLLRTLWIGSYPVGFTPDEASFGYDAYSILKTGADQWGHKFPLVLESFGDFKSPLYSYLTIPFVATLGLTKEAVRFPNAILGALSVFVIYLLAKKLSGNERLGLIASTLLTISPWHIMMSRGAFEANLITFFLPIGIYLFLIKKYSWAALSFGLCLFTYHSAKLITPIVFVSLLIIDRKELLRNFKKFILPLSVFLVFFVAMIYTFYLGGGARLTERSIAEGALEAGAKVKIELIQNGANPIIAKLMHNKYQVVASRFLNNYLQYFSPKFLFIKGPAETTYGMLPGLGVIYTFEGILLLGIVPLFIRKEKRILLLSIVVWLLISAVPAALATGVGYSANRAVAMIVPLEILISFGATGWTEFIGKSDKRALSIFTVIIAIFVASGFSKFVKLYFKNSQKVGASGMLYGNLEIAQWLIENDQYKDVIVSRGLSEPHIYIAFAAKWDPNDYQKRSTAWNYRDANVSWVDQIPIYSLGKYNFQKEDWVKKQVGKGSLLVARPGEFPRTAVPDKIINYPDGTPAIYAKAY